MVWHLLSGINFDCLKFFENILELVHRILIVVQAVEKNVITNTVYSVWQEIWSCKMGLAGQSSCFPNLPIARLAESMTRSVGHAVKQYWLDVLCHINGTSWCTYNWEQGSGDPMELLNWDTTRTQDTFWILSHLGLWSFFFLICPQQPQWQHVLR